MLVYAKNNKIPPIVDPAIVIVAKWLDELRPKRTPSQRKAKKPINKLPATRNLRFSVAKLSWLVFDNISTKSTKKKEITKKTNIDKTKHI